MDSTSYNRYSGITPKMVMLRPLLGGRYLNQDDVIRRVKAACACSAYAYVETSSEGARERALAWMDQPAFNDYLVRPEGLEEAALFVHFGDDLASADALLSMLLMPAWPLIVEYSPRARGDGVPALIARCAKVLKYEIVEQPATEEEESVAPHPQRSAPRPATVWEASGKFVAWFVDGIKPVIGNR